ncbi:hypothetical protein ACRRTK_016444 [Alexandromys fortis]
MSKYVNDMWPGSPQEKALSSPSDSGRSSHLSSRSRSRSSSRSSGAGSRSSSRSSSRSHSQPRRSKRSRSRSRRRHQRKYRRYSRSYSRSRSRSRGRHYYRDSGYGRPRRYYQSPSPYRSRSRSHSRGRSYHRRSYYAITRGRRYYGFGRTVYPEDRPRWRERSRTRSRSRSRTPFRLSEKDRMELLEIAKANAAKALGTANFDLPASLRTVAKGASGAAVSSSGRKTEHSEKQAEDGTKNLSEKSSTNRNIAFSSNNSIAKPLQKTAKTAAEETSSGSPKIDKKKSPYGLWIPV